MEKTVTSGDDRHHICTIETRQAALSTRTSCNMATLTTLLRISLAFLFVISLASVSTVESNADNSASTEICGVRLDHKSFRFLQYLFGSYDELVLRTLKKEDGAERVLFANLMNKDDRLVDFYPPSFFGNRDAARIGVRYLEEIDPDFLSTSLSCTVRKERGCKDLATFVVPRRISDVGQLVQYEASILERLLINARYHFSVNSINSNCALVNVTRASDEIGVTIVYVNPSAAPEESANCVATGYVGSLGYRGVSELFEDRQAITARANGRFTTNLGRDFVYSLIRPFPKGNLRSGMTRCDYVSLLDLN